MAPTRKSPAQLVNEYVAYCGKLNRSPDTIYSYHRTMSAFMAFLATRGVHVIDADHHDVRAFIDLPRRRNARGTGDLAPATIKRKVMELRSFYKWLQNIECCVHANPALRVETPTVHNEDPHPVPDDLWQQLWLSDTLSNSDRVAFGFAYFCGLRRHEVTLLRRWNVVAEPEPRLVGMKRKGGNRTGLPYASCVQLVAERLPHLIGDPDTFLGALHRVSGQRLDTDLLLPWREEAREVLTVHQRHADFILPDYFNKRLRYALRRIGLPERAFTPHALRHSFCTNLVRMGVDILTVARLANHSSVVVTQRYIKSQDDPLRRFLGDNGTTESEAITPVSRWV